MEGATDKRTPESPHRVLQPNLEGLAAKPSTRRGRTVRGRTRKNDGHTGHGTNRTAETARATRAPLVA
eukprot:3875137-Prymnesium_polylepis.1